MTNIIVYNDIPDEELFLNSLVENTKIIKYTEETKLSEIINILEIEDVSNIGFVYHYPGYNYIPFFNKDKNPLEISYNYLEPFIENQYIKTEFKNLLNYLVINNKNVIIDLISCNINDNDFINELNNIYNEFNIIIRYSTNDKGNLTDWVQESHNINIKSIYFNDNISEWDHILNSAITDPLTITDSNGAIFEKIDNIYYLKRSIVWNTNNLNISANTDFIQLIDNDILDGNGHTVYFSFAPHGFVAVNVSNPNLKPIIRNFNVNFFNISIAGSGGGIVRSSQRNFIIRNCLVIGNSRDYGGGIAGRYSKDCLIENCTHYGYCGHWGCGGIVGSSIGGISSIINCIHYGTLVAQSGGLTGNGVPSGVNSSLTIRNCASIGRIVNGDGGGLCGYANATSANSLLLIENCFTVGEINASNSGGFLGSSVATNGRCIVRNSYSTGDIISGNSGGISGPGSGSGLLIENCYTLGKVIGSGSGSFCGSSTNPTIKNCVSNGSTLVGSGTVTSINNLTNLSFITNNIPSGWDPSIWRIKNISLFSNEEWEMLASCRGLYGLKVMKLDYNGPIIRIRRSNDNLENDFFGNFNNLNIKDLVNGDNISLSSWLGGNSGFVVTWYDQSSYKNNVGQTDVARQPEISLTENSIVFTSDFLSRNSGVLSASASKYTYVANWRSNVNNTIQVIMEQNTSTVTTNRRGALLINGSSYGFNGQSNDVTLVPYTVNIFNKTIMKVENALDRNVEILHNLISYFGRSVNPSTLNLGNNVFLIGRKVDGSEYFNGSMKSIMVFENTFDNNKLDILYKKMTSVLYPTLSVYNQYPYDLNYKTYEDLPKIVSNKIRSDEYILTKNDTSFDNRPLRYPPKIGTLITNTLTEDTFEIRDENYGNGLYISRSITSFSTGFSSRKAFDYSSDRDSGSWASNISMSNDTGRTVNGRKVFSYNQTTYGLNVNGTMTYGQWISLETPQSIKIYKYGILPRYPGNTTLDNRRQPVNFVLLGSNDNNIWYEVHNEFKNKDYTGFSISTINQTRYFTVLSNTFYKSHALLVTAMTDNTANSVPPSLDLAELEFYSYDYSKSIEYNSTQDLNLNLFINKNPVVDNYYLYSGFKGVISKFRLTDKRGFSNQINEGVYLGFKNNNFNNVNSDLKLYKVDSSNNFVPVIEYPQNLVFNTITTKNSISFNTLPIIYLKSSDITSSLYVSEWTNIYGNNAIGSSSGNANLPTINRDEFPNYVRLGTKTSSNVNGNYFDLGEFTLNSSTNNGFTFIGLVRFNEPSSSWERIFDFSNALNNNITLARHDLNNTLAYTYYIGSTPTVNISTVNIIKGEWQIIALRLLTTESNLISLDGSFNSTGLTLDNRTLTNNYIGRSDFANNGYANIDIAEFMVFDTSLNLAEMNNIINQLVYKYNLNRTSNSNINLWNTIIPSLSDVDINFVNKPVIYLKSSDIPNNIQYVSTWKNHFGSDAVCYKTGTAELPEIRRDQYPHYVRIGTGVSSTVNGNWLNLGSYSFNALTNDGFTFIGVVKWWGDITQFGRVFDFGNGQSSNNIILYRQSTNLNYASIWWNGSSRSDYFHNTFTRDVWDVIAIRFRTNERYFSNMNGANIKTVQDTNLNLAMTDRTLNNTYIGRSHWNEAFANLDIREFMVFDKGLEITEIENIRKQLITKYNLEIKELEYPPASLPPDCSGVYISKENNIYGQVEGNYEDEQTASMPSSCDSLIITNNGMNVTWEISGQSYGNGFYTTYSTPVSLSGEIIDRTAYGMFNYKNDDIGWFNSETNQYTSTFSDINNCEYIVIILPEKIKLKRYILYSSNGEPNNAPKNWRIYGSNDNTNWTLITYQSNIIDWVNLTPREFSVNNFMSGNYNFNNNLYFNHYALVVTSSVSSTRLQISEWRLFGEPDINLEYNHLYNFALIDSSAPNTLIGGDPYILELNKNINSKAFIISNTWNKYYIYKSNNYKVIGYNNILEKEKILKMKKYINGSEFNIDNRYLKISKFKYLTKIEILLDDEIVLEIDTITGNINNNNNKLKYEKINTKNGLSLIRKNIYYPKKNFVAYCIYLDNNMLVIKIDNYWVELNNIKLYVNNMDNINNNINGELIEHCLSNKII
jgi:hypothetical protein